MSSNSTAVSGQLFHLKPGEISIFHTCRSRRRQQAKSIQQFIWSLHDAVCIIVCNYIYIYLYIYISYYIQYNIYIISYNLYIYISYHIILYIDNCRSWWGQSWRWFCPADMNMFLFGPMMAVTAHSILKSPGGSIPPMFCCGSWKYGRPECPSSTRPLHHWLFTDSPCVF